MSELNRTNEQKLIYRAQFVGDVDAISELIKINQSKVRAFLFRLTKNYALADDIAQDTFIIALERIGTYRRKGSFIAWLLKIAYNCFLKQCHRLNRRNEILEKYGTLQELASAKHHSSNELRLDIERALLLLSGDESAAFSLCISFGFSHSEAAKILQMPLGTLKSIVARAKVKLRHALIETG